MTLIYIVTALTLAGIAAWIINAWLAGIVNTVLTFAVTVFVIGGFLCKTEFVPFEDA